MKRKPAFGGDPSDTVVKAVADQLGIEPAVLGLCARRGSLRREHSGEIAALLDLRPMRYANYRALIRLGELCDRTAEDMAHRASGLNLVDDAIVLWNIMHLAHAVTYVRSHGIGRVAYTAEKPTRRPSA